MFCVLVLLCFGTCIALPLDDRCQGGECQSTISPPLVDHMQAALLAEIDVTDLNKNVKNFIEQEVKKEIQNALRSDIKEMVNESSIDISSRMESMLQAETEKIRQIKESKGTGETKGSAEKAVMVTLSAAGLHVKHFNSGDTITFSNVGRHSGISTENVQYFKTNGVFRCEVEGLYSIATTVMSQTNGGWFQITKNGNELFRTYIEESILSPSWHSSTGLTYANLIAGDKVQILAGSGMRLSGRTLTIIKLK